MGDGVMNKWQIIKLNAERIKPGLYTNPFAVDVFLAEQDIHVARKIYYFVVSDGKEAYFAHNVEMDIVNNISDYKIAELLEEVKWRMV